MSDDVHEIWMGIDSRIAAQTPQFSQLLNPPATEAEIAAAESQIGLCFPPSVRESYRIHNGESEESDGLFEVWRFLPLSDVIVWWQEMKLIEDTYACGDFDIGSMIPIMFMEGDLRYVDHSESGAETPLVEWRQGDPSRDQKAASFADFLQQFLQEFCEGKLIAEPEFDLKAIVPKNS